MFFPDVERAEWVNRIIKQAWPYANKYMEKAIFHDVMVPMIRGTSPALADFTFEKLDLGEIVRASLRLPKQLARCCRLASTHRRHQGLPGPRS